MDKNGKKEYELAFLVQDEAVVPRVLSFLKERNADINFEGVFKRIALAYEIRKMNHAFFGFIHVACDAETTAALQKELNAMPEVIRYFLVTPPIRRREKEKEYVAQIQESAPPLRRQAAQEAKPLPLSNEELERKIDEILK